jgi:5-methylcytosine-specific restriction endonuclease McrA
MRICNRCKSENIDIECENKFHNVHKCIDCNFITTKRIEECCRNPFLTVTIDNKNQQRKRLHKQCVNCGGCLDRTKALSFKSNTNKIRYEFSHFNYENWNAEREYERETLWNWISENNDRTSDYAKYREYLTSDLWKSKREKILFRDKNICQECKIKPAEEIHHITYENLYNELLEDLIALCKECHNEVHRKLNVEKMKELKLKCEQHLKEKAVINSVLKE